MNRTTLAIVLAISSASTTHANAPQSVRTLSAPQANAVSDCGGATPLLSVSKNREIIHGFAYLDRRLQVPAQSDATA